MEDRALFRFRRGMSPRLRRLLIPAAVALLAALLLIQVAPAQGSAFKFCVEQPALSDVGPWVGYAVTGVGRPTAGAYILPGRIDDGPAVPAYCVDLTRGIGSWSCYYSSVYTSALLRDDPPDPLREAKVACAIALYPPALDFNGVAPLGDPQDDVEAAARQSAIWHYSNGFELLNSGQTPSAVFTRYKAILADIDGYTNGDGTWIPGKWQNGQCTGATLKLTSQLATAPNVFTLELTGPNANVTLAATQGGTLLRTMVPANEQRPAYVTLTVDAGFYEAVTVTATTDVGAYAQGIAPGGLASTVQRVAIMAGGAQTASASVTVPPPCLPADANDDFYAVTVDTPLVVDASGVLTNDGPEGALLQVLDPGPYQTTKGGTIVINADGSFTYYPPAGYFGEDTFTYWAYREGNELCPDSATITFSVESRNQRSISVSITDFWMQDRQTFGGEFTLHNESNDGSTVYPVRVRVQEVHAEYRQPKGKWIQLSGDGGLDSCSFTPPVEYYFESDQTVTFSGCYSSIPVPSPAEVRLTVQVQIYGRDTVNKPFFLARLSKAY